MNEFRLIDQYFRHLTADNEGVILGIGDDAACLAIPEGQQLLVTTDTLVSGVHFRPEWNPYDIAYRSVMVNVSDIAAMAARPCWASLALTLPAFDSTWLRAFSEGLKDAFAAFKIALIGGDMTRGPLTISLTVHGLAPAGCAVKRGGALAGDLVFLSGEVAAAALAVQVMDCQTVEQQLKDRLLSFLYRPQPRVDYVDCLRTFANAAIDISDGLSADLQHLCQASGLGVIVDLAALPIHPLVSAYCSAEQAIELALTGGDDYQLCFTVSVDKEKALREALAKEGLEAYCIGRMDNSKKFSVRSPNGEVSEYQAKGYSHF